MSLYADEDLALGAGPSSGPIASTSTTIESSSTSNHQVPVDPLQALAIALSCPAESAAQAEALVAAGQRFEEHPEKLPDLCGQLLPMVEEGGESLLRSWTLDMVALAVGRSALQGEIKLGVAQTSLATLNRFLHGPSISTIKAVIPIFSTIHPILFRLLATSRPPQAIYDLFISSKARILALALDSTTQPQNVGIKASAWKYIQKVLLAGTRAAAADPRLAKQQGATSHDPSVTIISRDSLLSAPELEEEANQLRTQLVTQMYSLDDPALLHPLFQLVPLLCKARPALAPLLVSSLTSWTPAALEANKRPAIQIRAVEKTAKLVMIHLVKHAPLAAFSAQLNDALVRQKHRMEAAFTTEQAERKARKANPSASSTAANQPILGKHPMEAESSAQAAKRARYGITLGSLGGRGAEIDVTTCNIDSVIDVVMEALETVDEGAMRTAFDNARNALINGRPDVSRVLATVLGIGIQPKEEDLPTKYEDDDEVMNPLDMDMDDEDLLLTQDQEEEDEGAMTFTDFNLPPPEILDQTEKEEIANALIERVCKGGAELADLADVEVDGRAARIQPREMWMLLLARLATRGDETRRKAVGTYISEDFASRSKFAAIWLNEEWYSAKTTSAPSQYSNNLAAILKPYIPKIDAKDKSLSGFLALLPEIPDFVFEMLELLCEDLDRSIVGFLALRELIEGRPPVRAQALNTLLQLCTHTERKTRVLAISTIRRWVPGSVMSTTIVNYALGVLRKLVDTESKVAEEDTNMEEGEEPEVPVESRFLQEVTKDSIPQHVELAFALSRRHQDLLEDIFRIYPQLDESLQKTYEDLVEPLIQSLGPTEQLLAVLRKFPPRGEKLALRVVQILSAEGSSPKLAGLLKGLMAERELDPKFIIPIIGEMDKGEIEAQIPRIVSLLGVADARDTVRTAFASILQKMTPADLMVALHAEETALKATIEAIGICFSMTTVFRSDVLATSMSRIADSPNLPVVFLRTIIQAVTTYKSLIPFIANNVLPKLVNKKIWETSQLWDGFIRLAKLIAPSSYGVLLQLPKEWLKDVVDRQPGLKAGLKSFLAGKPQAKAAMAEIFGDDP